MFELMNLNTKLNKFQAALAGLFFLNFCSPTTAGSPADERIVKERIKSAGFVPSSELYLNPDEKLAPLGKVFFGSDKGLSLNGNISCKTCHQDRFGSADGIPNAAAIGGEGNGPKRLLSGVKLLPRNTLPFWGRGGKGFEVFFWDGRVDFLNGKVLSQFGSTPPSKDPLLTAIHLPVVEIREMLDEDEFVQRNKIESVENSSKVYKAIANNLKRVERESSKKLALELNKDFESLEYIDFARAIAAFIRSEFRIKKTKLELVMDGKSTFSDHELRGAKVFYGKGACVTCHSGPYFSDFKFHTVPTPQLGFGKNGFGVDYGRYNATFNPNDLYKFRTPPLYNVEKTAPYGHDGSILRIEEVITAHFNPLKVIKNYRLSEFDEYEFAKRLSYSESTTRVGYLTKDEVADVVAFLKTLSF